MNKFSNLYVPFLTILFAFVVLYVFSYLFGPLPFSVNSVTTNKSDMFTVTGDGEASAVPETAQFSVGVTETASNVEAAQNAANQTANEIIEGLKALGIKQENIQTTNYNVNPNYDFSTPGGRQNITGYTVSQNLNVEVTPVDLANQAIDVATQNGANTAGGVTFVLSDKKKLELEQQARTQAINQAKEKAKNIADAAGIRLGRLINVQESTFDPGPFPFERSAVALDTAEEKTPTQLEPGENTVNITVTLFYETL